MEKNIKLKKAIDILKQQVIDDVNYVDGDKTDYIITSIYARLQKQIDYCWHGNPSRKIDENSEYQCLVERYAVCDSIAKTFKKMCESFDIECELVRGVVEVNDDQVHFSEENEYKREKEHNGNVSFDKTYIGHTWNKVKLSSGDYSYLDLTSDITNGEFKDGLSKEHQEVTFKYFLVDNTELIEKGYFTDTWNSKGDFGNITVKVNKNEGMKEFMEKFNSNISTYQKDNKDFISNLKSMIETPKHCDMNDNIGECKTDITKTI